jgi:hypothetical protein
VYCALLLLLLLVNRLQVQRCLTKISAMTVDQVQEHYKYPNASMAWALNERAKDMLTKGFEWTLKHGRPVNPWPARYKWYPPCCQMQVTTHRKRAPGEPKKVLKCVGQEGQGPTEVPLGNPAVGQAWRFPAPDYGTYNLTALEEEGTDW